MTTKKANGTKGRAAPKAKIDSKAPETKKKPGNPAWVKGVSGNPGGLPAGVGEVKKLARSHTMAAINTLVEIMEDKDATASARVSAAESILNRGYGKPVQQVEVGRPGDFSAMTDAEVEAFIAKAARDNAALIAEMGDTVH